MPRQLSSEEAERRLFVGRLDYHTEDLALKYYFERFGDLTDFVIMRHPDSMKSRGFGFVTFYDMESLERCMESGPHVIDGKTVELSRAQARDEERGRGSFGGGSRARDSSGAGEGRARQDRDTDRRLFVGRLNFSTEDSAMRRYFEHYGELSDCIIMRWPDTMKSRGFGFVTFRHGSGLEKCLADGDHEIDGKALELTRATPKEGDKRGWGGHGRGRDMDEDLEEDFDPESKVMRRLFLGRLSFTATEEKLREYFERYGALAEVVVMKFNDTGRSRGFGFITYEKSESVDACQKDRPHEIDGKVIECKRATPRKDAKNPEATMEVKKIWVGGFNDDMSDESIKDYFGQFGRVLTVEQMKYQDSGKKRGFGFVEFDDNDTVDKICLIGRHHLAGKRLEVKKALNREQIEAAKVNKMRMQEQHGRDSWGSGGFGMDMDVGGRRGSVAGGSGGGNNMMAGMDMNQMFAMFMQQMMSMGQMGGGSGGGSGRSSEGSRGGWSNERGGGSSVHKTIHSGYSTDNNGSKSYGYSLGGGGWQAGGPVRSGLGSSARDSANPYSRSSSGGGSRGGSGRW